MGKKIEKKKKKKNKYTIRRFLKNIMPIYIYSSIYWQKILND
jgi:hypothetical protein